MSWFLNICFSLELHFSGENVWEDHRELTIFKAVLLSGNYLCVAQVISRKREDYEEPLVECLSVIQEALN